MSTIDLVFEGGGAKGMVFISAWSSRRRREGRTSRAAVEPGVCRMVLPPDQAANAEHLESERRRFMAGPWLAVRSALPG